MPFSQAFALYPRAGGREWPWPEPTAPNLPPRWRPPSSWTASLRRRPGRSAGAVVELHQDSSGRRGARCWSSAGAAHTRRHARRSARYAAAAAAASCRRAGIRCARGLSRRGGARRHAFGRSRICLHGSNRDVPCVASPRRSWLYSNVGYLFVRQIIEAAAGEEIGEAVARLVLAPLGILHAALCRDTRRSS